MARKIRPSSCHPDKKYFAKGFCKTCYDKAYGVANRAARNEKARDWAKKNPDRINRTRLKYRYGITQEQYNNMFAEQGGLCAICRKKPARDVDHNHQTDSVRGLLCGDCNRALGLIKEDMVALQTLSNT